MAEFGKYNDINSLDFCTITGKNKEEHFVRGLLTNLEFLALKWQLIEPTKYNYRQEPRNAKDGKLPTEICIQHFFHIKTFRLAQTKVHANAVNGEEILIEKEFALAGAKLVQQFQIVLNLIKTKLEPVFCPRVLDKFTNESDSEKSGIIQSLFTNLANNYYLDSHLREIEANKQQLMADFDTVNEFKGQLKKLERLIRIFEMTYLDLKDGLQNQVRIKNLQCQPQNVKVAVKINEKGQIIASDDQLFDKDAKLIDKQSRIQARQVSKDKDERSFNLNSKHNISQFTTQY